MVSPQCMSEIFSSTNPSLPRLRNHYGCKFPCHSPLPRPFDIQQNHFHLEQAYFKMLNVESRILNPTKGNALNYKSRDKTPERFSAQQSKYLTLIQVQKQLSYSPILTSTLDKIMFGVRFKQHVKPSPSVSHFYFSPIVKTKHYFTYSHCLSTLLQICNLQTENNHLFVSSKFSFHIKNVLDCLLSYPSCHSVTATYYDLKIYFKRVINKWSTSFLSFPTFFLVNSCVCVFFQVIRLTRGEMYRI